MRIGTTGHIARGRCNAPEADGVQNPRRALLRMNRGAAARSAHGKGERP